ncbi:hypothetical protein U1Q18_035462, partial [Sarracenia purpurea var. burkii]
MGCFCCGGNPNGGGSSAEGGDAKAVGKIWARCIGSIRQLQSHRGKPQAKEAA